MSRWSDLSLFWLGALVALPTTGVWADVHTELALRPGVATSLREAVPAPAPFYTVGDIKEWKVYNFATRTFDAVSCQLVAESEHGLVWVAEDELSAIPEEELATLVTALEDNTPEGSYDSNLGILPIEQAIFGAPPNTDGSGKSHIILTDIQDSYSSGCGCSHVAGFFDPVNLSYSDENSNQADIVYLDTYPSIYTETSAADVGGVLGTLAHEYQHLIHAGYGNLFLFQNEGQSEWAQLLCGYPGRSSQYLSFSEEVNRALFSWRGGDAAYDYQRASLFHSYLAQQVGEAALGTLSRSPTGGSPAYDEVLGGIESTFEEALLNFHTANWVGDVELGYGYSDVAHQGVKVPTPTVRYEGTGTTPLATRSLEFGGAEYIQWFGVEALSVELTGEEGVSFVAVTRSLEGVEGVERVSPGSLSWSTQLESLTLIAVNTMAEGEDELNGGQHSYSYSATWLPLLVSTQRAAYYDPGALVYFVSLPRNDEPEWAYRVSPVVDGTLRSVGLELTRFIDGSPNPAGEGTLVVEMATSLYVSGTGSDTVYAPGERLGAVRVPFTTLASGHNDIDVSGQNWRVLAGQDFQLVFRLEDTSSDAAVAFDLDEGSLDPEHPWYYPAHTRRYSQSEDNWNRTWLDSGNLAVSVSLVGTPSELTVAPLLVSPLDGATEVEPAVGLDWYPVEGAVSYRVEIAADGDFDHPIQAAEGIGETQLFVTELPKGEDLSWRVAATGALGQGPWSQVFQFTTGAAPIGAEDLAYFNANELFYTVSLPYGTETKWAVRYSPSLSGHLAGVTLKLTQFLDETDNPLGEGSLRLALASSIPSESVGGDVPGDELGSVEIPFGDLGPGDNFVDLTGEGWPVTGGEDFQVVISVVGSGASVALDLDNGSSNTADPNYYPARSRRYFEDSASWSGTWLGNGNFAVTAHVEAGEGGTPTPEGTPASETPTAEPATPTLEPASPTPAPATDAPTTPGGDDDDTGCGCTQGEVPGWSSVSLLLLVYGVRRRVRVTGMS